jgi:predicted RNA-binding Zn-ribbon protein involved in translation (DUF1610 family)
MDDFVTVATHFSMAEAEPERLALEAAGISVFPSDDGLSSLLTPTTFGGIKLQVPAAEAARAEQVLAELRADAPLAAANEDQGVSFHCPTCEAEIWFTTDRRGHVEVCPECGAHVDVPA